MESLEENYCILLRSFLIFIQIYAETKRKVIKKKKKKGICNSCTYQKNNDAKDCLEGFHRHLMADFLENREKIFREINVTKSIAQEKRSEDSDNNGISES